MRHCCRKQIKSTAMILDLTARELSAKCDAAFGRQSSSGVEQRTHKPLVGGSIPSSGTILRSKSPKVGSEHRMVFSVALAKEDFS
jgi:hypothetical protein